VIGFALMHAAFDSRRHKMLYETVWPSLQREDVHPIVVSDYTKRGPWEVAKEAWRHAHDRYTHWMVLQDDFVVCDNFLKLAHNFVDRHPNDACCVFQPAAFNPNDVKNLMNHGDFEVPAHMIPWGGSLILPVSLVPNVIEIGDILDGMGTEDDTRIAHALRWLNVPCYNVGVSLIKHIGAGHSVVQNPSNDGNVTYRTGFTYVGD